MAVVIDLHDPLHTRKDPLLCGPVVANRLRISQQALFGLRKRKVLKAEQLFNRWYFRESTILAYERDKDAQARRNRKSQPIDPSEHTPAGPVAGHNMPMEGTVGALTYTNDCGKLEVVEIPEKHIINTPGGASGTLPQASPKVLPKKTDARCLDCGGERVEGRTRCQKCLDIRARRQA